MLGLVKESVLGQGEELQRDRHSREVGLASFRFPDSSTLIIHKRVLGHIRA